MPLDSASCAWRALLVAGWWRTWAWVLYAPTEPPPCCRPQALPGLSAGQKKRLQIHPAGLLIILLSFGAWVVALGGVGSATSNCASGYKSNDPTSSAKVNCAKAYQWQWWGLWFEGCMLVAMFVAVFFESFNKGKQVVQSYLIMCTVVLMQSSNYFITNSQIGNGSFSIKDKLQVRARGWWQLRVWSQPYTAHRTPAQQSRS